MSKPVLGLFAVFAPLSLVTVGGGQTVIAEYGAMTASEPERHKPQPGPPPMPVS